MSWNSLHQWVVNYSDSRQLKEDDFEVITNKFSMEATTESGSSILHFAAIGKSSTLLSLILQNCKSVDDYINLPNENGETPLHWACRQGTLKVVKVLLKNGANVRSLDKELNIPLHYACESGQASIVKYLIKKKSKIDAQNSLGKTPLIVACEEHEFDVISILVAEGSPTIQLLPKLIQDENIECVVPILQNSCFASLINSRRQNPLHLTVLYDNYDAAEIVMALCPEFLQCKDSTGKTPCDLLHGDSNKRFRILFS